MTKKILFYSSVKSLDLLYTQKFYQIDIAILQDLGYQVILTNKIIDSLKFWKYNILFSYFYRYSFFPSFIAKCLGKRTYFTGGIDDLDESYASPRKYAIQKIFFRLCYWVANSCIIVSHSDLKNISKILNGRKKISFSEHAIDVTKFTPNMYKKSFFSTIVWMGEEGNVKRKGVDKALLIFSKLKQVDNFKEHKFIIIGRKGAGTHYVEMLIKKYKLQDDVIITGEVSEDEKISILKQSEFYFQLSLYEGFGLSSLEALCAGCVIIHSGKGGLSSPAYSDQILFNIDNDFDSEYNNLLSKLQKKKLTIHNMKNLKYYDIKRRKEDFNKILNKY